MNNEADPNLWSGQLIELEDWSDFAPILNRSLSARGHIGHVAIRNFHLVICELDDEMLPIGETDRLALALRTGTDRDSASLMWNAEGHDFDHDLTPSGKRADEIVYAYVAELTATGYRVQYLQSGPSRDMDLTRGLCQHDGILVYDAAKLDRVAKNEHWFKGDPLDALLLVFKLAQAD